MTDTAQLFRALGERLTRLGLVAAGGDGELEVELAGLPCRMVVHAGRVAPLVEDLHRRGRLALAARYSIDDAAVDVLIHAPAATAPRGAMRKLLDALWSGGDHA